MLHPDRVTVGEDFRQALVDLGRLVGAASSSFTSLVLSYSSFSVILPPFFEPGRCGVAIVRVAQTEGDPAELEQRYRRVQERLRGGGDWPPAGLKVHTAMKTPTGLRVANIWESEEQADAVWPRIAQALRDEGGSPEAMQFEQYEVINLITT